MDNFTDTYVYFVSLSILGVAIYVTGILLFRKFSLSIIISSFAAVPQALLGAYFFTGYWQNPRITGGAASLEDFLFCFIAGGGAWISVLAVLHNQISVELKFNRNMLRFMQVIITGVGSMWLLYLGGIRNFLSPYLAIAICGLLPVLIKRQYLIVWISGAVLFSIIYLIAFLIVNAIWPQFVQSWNLTELSGRLILGIPLEEYMFSVLYGGSMGTCMAYIFNTRFIEGSTVAKWLSKLQNRASNLLA